MSDEKLQTEFPKTSNSGSGNEVGYFVEARFNHHEPRIIGGVPFDNRWRCISVEQVEGRGVPVSMPFSRFAEGLMNYEAAEAIRWIFHSIAAAEHNGLCLETRIVKVKTSYSHDSSQIGAYGHVGGDAGERPSSRPKGET